MVCAASPRREWNQREPGLPKQPIPPASKASTLNVDREPRCVLVPIRVLAAGFSVETSLAIGGVNYGDISDVLDTMETLAFIWTGWVPPRNMRHLVLNPEDRDSFLWDIWNGSQVTVSSGHHGPCSYLILPFASKG